MNASSERTIYDVQRDLDLDQLLDAAVPPPTCEWQTTEGAEPCGAPATWILSAACGHSSYYDDAHAEALRAAGIGDLATGPTLCSKKGSPRHAPLVKADPIRFDRIAS